MPLLPRAEELKIPIPKRPAVTARWHMSCPIAHVLRCRATPGPGPVPSSRPPRPAPPAVGPAPALAFREREMRPGPARRSAPVCGERPRAARAILGTRQGQRSPSLRKMAAAG